MNKHSKRGGGTTLKQPARGRRMVDIRPKETLKREIPLYCQACSYCWGTLKQVGNHMVIVAGLSLFTGVRSFCPMCRQQINYDQPKKTFDELWDRHQKRLQKP